MSGCHLSSVGASPRGPTAAGRARTDKARETWLRQFEQQVDPDRKLDPTTRAQLAAEARRNWMRLLALRSTQVRQAERRARLAREQQIETDEARQACPHTWPGALSWNTVCLDCGLPYIDWDAQLADEPGAAS